MVHNTVTNVDRTRISFIFYLTMFSTTDISQTEFSWFVYIQNDVQDNQSSALAELYEFSKTLS